MPRKNGNGRARFVEAIEGLKDEIWYFDAQVQMGWRIDAMLIERGEVSDELVHHRVKKYSNDHHCLFYEDEYSQSFWCNRLRTHFQMRLLLDDHSELHKYNDALHLPRLPEHVAEYACKMLRAGRKSGSRDIRRLVLVLADFLRAYESLDPDSPTYVEDCFDQEIIKEVILRLCIQAEFLEQKGYLLPLEIDASGYYHNSYSHGSSISAIDLSATM